MKILDHNKPNTRSLNMIRSYNFPSVLIIHYLQNLELICDPSCLNGGLCARDRFDVERCFCPPGYTGERCENSKHLKWKDQMLLRS